MEEKKSNRYVRSDAIYNPIEGKWEKRLGRAESSKKTVLEEEHKHQLQWAKEGMAHLRDSAQELKTPSAQTQAEKEAGQTESRIRQKVDSAAHGPALQRLHDMVEEQVKQDEAFWAEDEEEEDDFEELSDEEDSKGSSIFELVVKILALLMALIALFGD